MGKLDGKVALVTGGASGLGMAIAKRFSEEGAKLVLADVNADGKTVADGLTEAVFVQTDVTDPEAVKRMVTTATETYGNLDVLVNNAGIDGEQAPTHASSLENWRQVIDVNLNGTFYGMKYGIEAMLAGGGGVVINMGSTVGMVAFGNIPPYTASKAGVIHLARAASIEYAKDNVRCFAVCPTVVKTPLVEHFITSSPEPNETRAMFENMNPLPGMPTPEDVAGTTLFLASDDARFLSGVVIPVDGAYTAQ